MKNRIRKSKTLWKWAAACLLLGFLLFPQVAFAHESITVSDYVVEYGWLSEPAIVGQPNAVVINITPANLAAGDTPPEIDISGLQIQVVYGPQSKILTLQPLGENTPGQFIAPITPMIPGKYTIHLGGSIGGTAFNNDVQPEEVQTADVVQFPADPAPAKTTSGLGLAGWLGIAGSVLGVLGTILGIIAIARK